MSAVGWLRHPARLVPAAVLLMIGAGTVLLMLPVARSGSGSAPWNIALFTSTGALCGALGIVDSAGYWSGFGEATLVGLMQVGGFGIMTMATLLGIVVSRRLGLSTRLLAQSEFQGIRLGEVRSVVVRIAQTTLAVEAIGAVILALRFSIGYDMSPATAAWHGVFHSVSAFNNAGFALYPDNLMRYVADPWVSLTVAFSALLGGIGFPVLFELRREFRQPARWSIHTKLTMVGSAILLAIGTVGVLGFEWRNPATLGPLDWPGKLLAAFFGAVTPRTAGFNTIDYAQAHAETLALTDALMFIGGGSAGTAGGIKLTTFFLLGFAILAEIRGERDVTIFHRRVGFRVLRQALTVALLGVAVAALGTFALLITTDQPLDAVMFNAMSAFGSVGTSVGVTPELPIPAQLVLIVIMYLGRTGPVAAATALALRSRHQLYRLPKERPIVG
jgi:potassium uptake TrkH family protein